LNFFSKFLIAWRDYTQSLQLWIDRTEYYVCKCVLVLPRCKLITVLRDMNFFVSFRHALANLKPAPHPQEFAPTGI